MSNFLRQGSLSLILRHLLRSIAHCVKSYDERSRQFNLFFKIHCMYQVINLLDIPFIKFLRDILYMSVI